MQTNVIGQLNEETNPYSCPECGGRLSNDDNNSETACIDCGLVTSEQLVDLDRDWRSFSYEEYEQKSRVGRPTTKTLHDKGLTTSVGRSRTDAKGNTFTVQQRQKIHRLRKWNERCRAQNSAEQHLRQALGELDRMASSLGIPQSIREIASVIYRQAHDDGLVIGRSIEAVTAASLYAATRQQGLPRTLDEVGRVARVEKLPIARSYRAIVSELGLAMEPPDPTNYVPKIASELNCSEETRRKANKMLESAAGCEYTIGKHPAGLAAAALYAGGKLSGERLTQREISQVSDITPVTIRTHYRDLIAEGIGGDS